MKFTCRYTLLIFRTALLLSDASAQNGKGSQKMLRHTVLVTFKPGTLAAEMLVVDKSFKNLAALKMVKAYEWGVVSSDRDTSHSKYMYVTTFAGKKEEAAYGESPQQQKHIQLGASYIESVSALDFYTSK